MEVTLRIATKDAPTPSVSVSGTMKFNSTAGLDEFLASVKVARDWLKKREEKK